LAEISQPAFGEFGKIFPGEKISPAFGVSSPPMRWSSVLLPAAGCAMQREEIAARNFPHPRAQKFQRAFANG